MTVGGTQMKRFPRGLLPGGRITSAAYDEIFRFPDSQHFAGRFLPGYLLSEYPRTPTSDSGQSDPHKYTYLHDDFSFSLDVEDTKNKTIPCLIPLNISVLLITRRLFEIAICN
jgi:hypothetical protein